MTGGLIVFFVLAVLVLIIIAKTAIVVPQQSAYVVERLGRYSGTLSAGFHVLLPFVDTIRYRHSLKEMAVDIPAQVCITRDNVQVGVDGVLYLKVLNPERASYGISDYMFAISQLAQTTLRSEVGKIDLDKTFEERTNINTAVVSELDKASESWGVKVLRYEIKNITPPHDILAAMEKQMRAEREKRAVILTSEGSRDAAINNAEGVKQEVIKASEARKQQQINEAEGQASAIMAVATATAEGIRRVAEAIKMDGGYEAVQLRVAEQYIGQFGELAKKSTTLVLPANVADVGSMIALAMAAIRAEGAGGAGRCRAQARPDKIQHPNPNSQRTPNAQILRREFFGSWRLGVRWELSATRLPRQRDHLEALSAADGCHGLPCEPPQRGAIAARRDQRSLRSATSPESLRLRIGAAGWLAAPGRARTGARGSCASPGSRISAGSRSACAARRTACATPAGTATSRSTSARAAATLR